MAVNVEIKKNGNESNANMIRRFTKRVQGAGIIPRIRKNRYHKRTLSKNVVHKDRMVSLKKTETYEELLKLGKIQEPTYRR